MYTLLFHYHWCINVHPSFVTITGLRLALFHYAQQEVGYRIGTVHFPSLDMLFAHYTKLPLSDDVCLGTPVTHADCQPPLQPSPPPPPHARVSSAAGQSLCIVCMSVYVSSVIVCIDVCGQARFVL